MDMSSNRKEGYEEGMARWKGGERMTTAKTKVPRKASTKTKGKASPKAKPNPVGCPRQWKSVEAMSEAIEAYFAKCDARKVTMIVGKDKTLVDMPKPEPYIVQRLAVFLDLTMKGLSGYEAREEFGATIKRAKARIEANKVLHMLDGDGPVAAYIFDLKNNYQWKDAREVNILNNPELQIVLDLVANALKPFPKAGEVVQEALDDYADKHGE
jgi:hypothetical protein